MPPEKIQARTLPPQIHDTVTLGFEDALDRGHDRIALLLICLTDHCHCFIRNGWTGKLFGAN
jgi:hypothetical protein